MFEPHLVKNDKGEYGIRLVLDNFGIVQPLPHGAMVWEEAKLREYFESVVPGMRQELIKMRNAHIKKLRKKCESGSTRSVQNSDAKILQLHPQQSSSTKC